MCLKEHAIKQESVKKHYIGKVCVSSYALEIPMWYEYVHQLR